MNIYSGEELNKKSQEIMELIHSATTDYEKQFLEINIRLVLHRLVEEVKDNTKKEILLLITTKHE